MKIIMEVDDSKNVKAVMRAMKNYYDSWCFSWSPLPWYNNSKNRADKLQKILCPTCEGEQKLGALGSKVTCSACGGNGFRDGKIPSEIVI